MSEHDARENGRGASQPARRHWRWPGCDRPV